MSNAEKIVELLEKLYSSRKTGKESSVDRDSLIRSIEDTIDERICKFFGADNK